MRNLFTYILIILISCLANAANIDIINTSLNGKPAYLIKVKEFQRQKDAEILQKTLSSSIKQTVKIDHISDKGLYIVLIGPINDYAVALKIKEQMSKDNSLDSESKIISFSELSSKKVIQSNDDDDDDNNNNNNNNKYVSTDNYQDESTEAASKVWNLRNADIKAVIAEVSRITGKNFVVDPKVQGKISIVSSSAITDKELYQVFLSMLQISGFAAIPSGNIIKIVPNSDARTIASQEINSIPNSGVVDEMLVQVIPIKYVPAEQLVPVLRPLMPQWSSVTAYGPSNMLILSGRSSNIRQLSKIIRQVDNSSSNGIDIVPLEHALAMDVANTLKDLVKSQMGANQRNQSVLSADDRSNSILISGSKTDRLRLRLLISQLDSETTNSTNSNTQVIYLHYLRAEDLVPILAGIAQASFSGVVGTTIGSITRPVLDSTNPASSMASLAPGSNNPAPNALPNPNETNTNPDNISGANTQSEGSTKPTVQIIAEPNTNSIIINAPATLIRTLKNVISQLDIKPAQLLIEGLVAEINESDFKDLGVEWGAIDQKTKDSSTFRPGFAILNSKTSISQFQSQIYALAKQKKANILSTPSVVVLDNRQAKILIGKQVSVAATSYPNNAGGTTSASPFTTFDRVNVALHLYVRPQITRGDGIQMQIDQGNDTLDTINIVDPGVTPTFNISAIVTSVHVESGDIIVLGGLAQDSLSNDNNNLPILGEIPGIGRLFQRKIVNREKKVLMVFIRPHILKTEKQGLEVTGSKYNHLRMDQIDIARSQEEFNRTDKNTIVPAWHSADLPKPFCKPKINSKFAEK
ncbi:MAG: GspD family T2SS secretin variant LspD [Legionellaceae bacterium]|nr:GspD family T2SS secretin variant LspD [Legionellaceae bacterium]